MDGEETFDRLVAQLSLSERYTLLNRLETQSVVSSSPMFKPDVISEKTGVERKFQESTWYTRLYFRVLSVFRSKPPLVLFEDSLVNRLGSTVELRFPGLYDHRRSLLLKGFRDELHSLKESARFFYEALDGSIGRDKGAFFAFLGSLEIDDIHQRLGTEADPYNYASTNSTATEQDVRLAINRIFESAFQAITEEDRRTMYRDVRSLLCLRELASFLFDRTLSAFSSQEVTCQAYILLDQLKSLNNILYSLEFPPSLPLLESLFVFNLQERIGTEGFNLELETRSLMLKAETALAVIRQFNQKVPLSALVRCASRNLSYEPDIIPGGEDWFPVYRDFWRKYLDDRLASFIKDRRREQLAESLAVFLKGKPLIPLSNSSVPGGIPVRSAFILSFLQGFHAYIFAEDINKVLKPILIDGEFYKRENRAEFTEAYNDLLKLGDSIRKLDRRIAPDGDLGRRYDMAYKEVVALPVKRRKLGSITQEADAEASSIVEKTLQSIRSLSGILNGILNSQAGGRYDSLTNLSAFSSRGSSFISSLRFALQMVDKTLQLLGELEALESVR